MAFKEYGEYDALGLAGLVKRGEVSPVEILEEAIAKIEKLNPKINAVITKAYDMAEKAVDGGLPDGIFKGVPILLKDILQTCKGMRYTMGSKFLKDFVPNVDSEYVVRVKKTGAVILGKTNVPEFGLMGVTEPEYFGPTKNPWNIKYTSGGSSGGSAAAVASRMVPIATGNDGGGSIRIPASCCGVFGLKPSRGRTPNGPEKGEVWMGLVAEHVLTRSVRDSAAMLDATQGSDTGAPYEIKEPGGPYLKAIEVPPDRLRIAFSTELPLGGRIHPECKKAVTQTAKLLEDLGHIVEEKTPEVDFVELARSYIISLFGEVAFLLSDIENSAGRKIQPGDVEVTTWIISRMGYVVPIWRASWAKCVWDRAARVMGRFHQSYDVYMTPTMSYPPARIGEVTPSFVEKKLMRLVDRLHLYKVFNVAKSVEKIAYRQLTRMPYTQIANQTGQPAMSVPLYWMKNNLPIGVHFMAGFGREDTLLKLAAQLEEAKPWAQMYPKL